MQAFKRNQVNPSPLRGFAFLRKCSKAAKIAFGIK